DLAARRVIINENDVSLTGTEYDLLAELVNRMDAIVTHAELLRDIWGAEYLGSNHYLHTYIGRLRKKLGEYSDLVETIPGTGYSFRSKKLI
ncbi:MAG: winged helix-turn-helix domain-containing protein, partial [Brevefilum sp.]|nr:winged helix-turn-helix domain-containing protein [Brevefilum sp.]